MNPADDPFLPYFARAGYRLARDSKGRYVDGMWKLLGGDLTLARGLREDALIHLFSNAQLRKGRAFTYRELLSMAQPGSDDALDRFNAGLMALVERQILLRGYLIHCPFCDLHDWYELADISEPICQGCRSPLRVPLELNFAYRLNRLFMEGLKQGALTVLLTALLWMEQATDAVIWRAGYSARKNGTITDLDLVAITDDGLLLAECKDNFKDDASAITEVIQQLRAGLTVAQDVGAAHFVFATLRQDVPDALREFISANPDMELLDGHVLRDR